MNYLQGNPRKTLVFSTLILLVLVMADSVVYGQCQTTYRMQFLKCGARAAAAAVDVAVCKAAVQDQADMQLKVVQFLRAKKLGFVQHRQGVVLLLVAENVDVVLLYVH